MTSIFKVIEDNRGKPLSLREIMHFSGKAEHKVKKCLTELKKQGFLKVIMHEDGDRFLLKEDVRLTENDISESKYEHYFSRVKEILSNLIFEQEEKESVRNKSLKEELTITHTHTNQLILNYIMHKISQ